MRYDRRTRCGSCDSEQLITVLDLGDSPPANGDDPMEKYPLQLGVCLSCALIQQMTLLPDKTLFGGTYHFYSSASAPKVQYHHGLAELLWNRHLADVHQPTVMEVACNDGDLLRHFTSRCRTIGVEPARGPALMAQERGLEVLNWPFSRAHAESMVTEYGEVDLLIANHVIAHIIDVNGFAAGIATMLKPKGVAVLEFQYAQDMVVGNQFDHVYHEHRYHFTVKTINDVMSRQGLFLINAEWVEPQGGSIRVTFSKFPFLLTAEQDARRGQLIKSELWMAHPHAYRDLQGRANWVRDRLTQLIKEANAAKLVVAGYGATAKSVSMINFCELTEDDMRYVVDTTPHKQGRTIPGTTIPIIASQDMTTPPDMFVMWAWNYASYILRSQLKFTEDGGLWLIPTPYPTVI